MWREKNHFHDSTSKPSATSRAGQHQSHDHMMENKTTTCNAVTSQDHNKTKNKKQKKEPHLCNTSMVPCKVRSSQDMKRLTQSEHSSSHMTQYSCLKEPSPLTKSLTLHMLMLLLLCLMEQARSSNLQFHTQTNTQR